LRQPLLSREAFKDVAEPSVSGVEVVAAESNEDFAELGQIL
jgi:hypothetical protein